MKFAEDFDHDLVPEWRDKYFDYKTGKRLVKAVQRALSRTNGLSNVRRRRDESVNNHDGPASSNTIGRHHSDVGAALLRRHTSNTDSTSPNKDSHSRDSADIYHTSIELLRTNTTESTTTRHIGSPVNDGLAAAGSLQAVASTESELHDGANDLRRQSLRPLTTSISNAQVGESQTHTRFWNHNIKDTPKPGGLRRFPTTMNFARVATTRLEQIVHPLDMFSLREQELLTFMHNELQKIETFFKEREVASGDRLEALRQQLHIMRHRRVEEVAAHRKHRRFSRGSRPHEKIAMQHRASRYISSKLKREDDQTQVPFTPIRSQNHKAFEDGDFSRRRPSEASLDEGDKVSHRHAKQKLRTALQEYYRELELMKSYSLLNRTAFRKLNKKYEKATNPNNRPTFQWFNQNVDTAYFVTSTQVELYAEAAEDLYARYFEKGNHKLGASKLRELTKPHGDKSNSALVNGLFIGIGMVFAIEGAWDGILLLSDDDEDVHLQTRFLLQLYAGYFLMLYLFTLFCICCRVWTAYKVNYPFIFEFDTRHHLDWRQLAVFAAAAWFLAGGTIFLNFSGHHWWEFGRDTLSLWYPVALIGVTLLMILLPLPIFRWRSRQWFAFSLWRLLCSGFYPVEFRDLFFGDMFASLTFAVANVETFICLYATWWRTPNICGSAHSRVFGFLAAVPVMWRSLQCIRRYFDSRKAFPHLPNLLKYVLTIATSCLLSLYRLDNSRLEFSLYIAFAAVTAIYCSIWDVMLDFSLIQSDSKYFGLRNTLAFDKPWLYYLVILVDPLLRFAWIPMVFYTHNLQHGSYIAFIVAFLEATRRGLWALFRVENEHCTNITLNRASRNVPLPYKISGSSTTEVELENTGGSSDFAAGGTTTAYQSLQGNEDGRVQSPKLQRATTVKDISRILARAHRQDFVKKKTELTFQDAEAQRSAEADGPGRGVQDALESDEGSDHDDEHDDERNTYRDDRENSSDGADRVGNVNSDSTLTGMAEEQAHTQTS